MPVIYYPSESTESFPTEKRTQICKQNRHIHRENAHAFHSDIQLFRDRNQE